MCAKGAAAASAKWLALALLLLWTSAAPVLGQDNAGTPPAKIIVGTMRVPPFVLRSDDGQWSGLSIELWKHIAGDLKRPYEFREYDYDLAGLLNAVERSQIDVAVAAIPITIEGEARFDFTHPYFTAGLGIAVHAESQSGTFAMLASIFTRQFVVAIAALTGLLLVVGMLIWLLERRHKAHFDPRPSQGIADGVWWAAVTMTTTGYGDKVPVTVAGRVLGMVWMFASIFLVALFSATLASSFVVGRLKTGISGPSDLVRVRVAGVAGTTGEQWLSAQGIVGRTYPFAIQAVKALQRGDVQALVHERAILGYMIKEYGWRELEILPHTLAVREYAIAVPTDSVLKEPINRAMLKVIHGPDWRDLVQHYVGSGGQTGSAD